MAAPPTELPSIVITTIHLPTPSVYRFAGLADWQVVIVGDRRTPKWPEVSGIRILDVEAQKSGGWELASILPFDHYSRKNIGYLDAVSRAVSLIADSDDDNAPLPGWGEVPEMPGPIECVVRPEVLNVYRLFTHKLIWPRGLPLGLIRDESEIHTEVRQADVAVWQGLADGDPDVDALYRLVVHEDPEFVTRPPIALAPGVVAPMNSQNTIWHPAAYAYLYLPFTVSFRFTDILRGYVAQYGIQAMGKTVGFTSATVYQDRNDHDLLRDLVDEVPVYTQTPEALDAMAAAALTGNPVEDLPVLYGELERIGVVTADERRGVDAWLTDFERANSR